MANHPSSLKRERQAQKQRTRNRSKSRDIQDMTKELLAAPKAKTAELFKALQSKISKFSQKGSIHKNTAARMIARLSRNIAAK